MNQSYRRKQDKIDEVHSTLLKKYSRLGILAEDDVLRGDDTIRVHVKKFDCLHKIEEALEAVETSNDVVIEQINFPISWKNMYQKKGFIAYLKFAEVSMVEEAQRILQRFDEFEKSKVMTRTHEQ